MNRRRFVQLGGLGATGLALGAPAPAHAQAASQIRTLQRHEQFSIERIPQGTNLFRMSVKSVDPLAYQKRLAARRVLVSAPQRDRFLIAVNETLNRMTAAELSDAFVRALAG